MWGVRTGMAALAACVLLGTASTAAAAPSAARPVVGKRPVAVTGAGVALVPVACPRVGPTCRGQAVLRATAGRRRPTLGAGSFVMRPGRTARVRVRLTAGGVRAVARNRTLRLQVVVATRAGSRTVHVARRIALRRPASPSRPKLVRRPPAATNERSATFRFKAVPGVVYECKLDARPYARCGLTTVYTGLADGEHVLLVRPRQRVRGLGATLRYRWRVGIPPAAPAFAAGALATVTAGTPASVAFSSATAGVTFLCSLDGGPFTPCTSPVTYPNLRPGVHTVAVKARDAAGRESAASALSLTVMPAAPVITEAPIASTTVPTARLAFIHSVPGVTFLCSLDGGPDTPCASPVEYRNLALGAHTFRVKASAGGVASAPASAAWSVVPLLPDVIAGIENLGIRTIDLPESPYDGQRGLFFATDVINVGNGPLEIRTSPTVCQSPEGPGRVASQRVFRDMDGNGIFNRPADEAGSSSSVIGCIAYHAAHRHQHFQEFGVYQLFRWSSAGRGELVSQSDKISYCMIDEKPYDLNLTSAPANPFYPYARVCRAGDDSFMGVSVGWNDQYGADRPDQFVPIDGLPEGSYCLRIRTDYMNRLVETNDRNNDASVVVTLNGGTSVSTTTPVTINRLRC